eukprot:12879937-Prorocentrum_lima.AAC.1
MGWRQRDKQLIHMLPFHPNTNLLRTSFKDANQQCAMVMIDLKAFLLDVPTAEVFIASSGVLLSATPIPWEFIRCVSH